MVQIALLARRAMGSEDRDPNSCMPSPLQHLPKRIYPHPVPPSTSESVPVARKETATIHLNTFTAFPLPPCPQFTLRSIIPFRPRAEEPFPLGNHSPGPQEKACHVPADHQENSPVAR